MMLGYVCQFLTAMFVLQRVYVLAAEPTQCDRTKIQGELTKQQQYECLVDELFVKARYNPLVRPVQEINETLTIDFSVQLSQIVDIDEKNQMMKTNVWLQMYWTDYQLVWDSKKYPDVKVLSIEQSKAWTPDIVLFNNADGNYEVSYRSNTLVYPPTGYRTWVPPAIYKSSCTIDVQYFPFDEQICEMKFGSWTFNEKQLNFKFFKGVRHLDVSDYLKSGAWDLIEGNANITRSPTGTNNQFKSLVIFKLVLRRKTLFYTVNLIIPCVLISFVTISVFILPADAGEKITLCISILLALVVFLLLISKILPPAIKIPLISQYLLFTFIMNILAIMATVIVINRNYRTPRTHHMPYWVRLVFLNYLPRILLMKRPDHDERWRDKNKEKVPKNKKLKRAVYNPNPDLTRTGAQGHQIAKPEENFHPRRKHNQTAGTGIRSTETTFIEEPAIPLVPEVSRAAESLKYISNHLKKDDDYGKVLEDWKYVARVIDRLLLVIFLIVTIGGTAGLLLKAPHIFESVKQQEIINIMNRNWDEAKRNNSAR